jgi:hypothetical protein
MAASCCWPKEMYLQRGRGQLRKINPPRIERIDMRHHHSRSVDELDATELMSFAPNFQQTLLISLQIQREFFLWHGPCFHKVKSCSILRGAFPSEYIEIINLNKRLAEFGTRRKSQTFVRCPCRYNHVCILRAYISLVRTIIYTHIHTHTYAH